LDLNKEKLPEEWKVAIIIPIYKKGDKTDCGNYRGISLLSTTYIILSNILLSKSIPYAEEIVGDLQCGFGCSGSTIDHIFCIRQIREKKWEYNETVYQLFIVFKKAYDSVRREVLNNILIQIGIRMKLIRLIKTCLNESYSTVRVGKHLSEIFFIKNDLKQGDALSLVLFNFTIEDAIRRVKVKQDGLKLNGTYQVLVNADDVSILCGSVHTIKSNKEDFLAGSKETGLAVNADKTKCMVTSRDQNAGQSHNLKIENNFFERVVELKYMRTSLTNQNFIQEEIKNTLKSGNACYHSVQNRLSSSLLSINIKIKIHRSIILPVALYGCETRSLTLGEERKLRVFQDRMLKRICGPKRDVITGEWRKLNNQELNDLYYLSDIFGVIKSRRMRRTGNVACMGRGKVY